MSYVQIVYRKKPRDIIYMRAAPSNDPTPYQREARRIFSEIARQAKGMKMKDFPPAAELVKERMSGMRIGSTPKIQKWMIVLAGASQASERSFRDALRYLTGT